MQFIIINRLLKLNNFQYSKWMNENNKCIKVFIWLRHHLRFVKSHICILKSLLNVGVHRFSAAVCIWKKKARTPSSHRKYIHKTIQKLESDDYPTDSTLTCNLLSLCANFYQHLCIHTERNSINLVPSFLWFLRSGSLSNKL